MVHKSSTLEILRHEKWATSQVKKGLRVSEVTQVQKKWGPFLFGEGKAMGGRASRLY
jgi:hypothetical protein